MPGGAVRAYRTDVARSLPYADTVRLMLALPADREIVAVTPDSDDNGSPVYRVRIACGLAVTDVEVSALLVRELSDLRSTVVDATDAARAAAARSTAA